MGMQISKEALQAAAKAGLITEDQGRKLWEYLAQRDLLVFKDEAQSSQQAKTPRFSLDHVLYYLGGLIVIGAMSWFMVSAWDTLGGFGIAAFAAVFAGAFFTVGRNLWLQDEYKIPGGILVAAAVAVVPLIVYGIQKGLGFWPSGSMPTTYQDYHIYTKGNFVLMELITIFVACAVIRVIRFPFITFPAVLALWYLSMDVVPWLLGSEYNSWEFKRSLSLCFGMVMVFVTYFIDRRTKEDFAFWGYLFGALIFWGALSSMRSNTELAKFVYCLVNLGLIFLSVFLSRRIFIVLGSMGVFYYIGHLAHKVFKDSLIFPIVLALIGVLIIYIGILYQKNKEAIHLWILSNLPESVRALRPEERN